MAGITHKSIGNVLSRPYWEAADAHEITAAVDFSTCIHKFDHLVESTASHGVNIEGLNIKQTASVIELLAETVGDELRAVQTRAYDAASQLPTFQIEQKSTGECIFRYVCADNDGTAYWCHGQIGRSGVSPGTEDNNWYLLLDATAVALRAHYALDSTCGRILINTESRTAGPDARLEVRGSADEVQAIFKGHSTQTSDIVQVRQSDGTVVYSIGNTGVLNYVGEIYGRASYGALYLNGSPAGATGVPIIVRTTGVTPGFAATERMRIGADAAVVPITWAACTHTGLDITSGQVLKVNGTQVVGARVIDARCDDVCNSGDATTDGVIDALRDAMITHGLIAVS